MAHLPFAKIISVIAILYTLIFSLEDLIGRERVKKFGERWLAFATDYFTVLTRRIRHSSTMWGIVIVVFIASSVAVSAFAVAGYLEVVARRSDIMIFLIGLGFILALWCSLFLEGFLQRGEVADFIHDHSDFVEVRILARIRDSVVWAVDDTEQRLIKRLLHEDRFRLRPPAGWNIRLLGTLILISVATSLLLSASLLIRTVILIVGCILWTFAFAPAIGLDHLARWTGADNFINVGKYIVLVIGCFYGFIHS